MTPEGMARLISSAQRRNRQLDLTGALIYCGHRFVQALEGREAALEAMMAKIVLDPRHRQLLVLARQPISKRLFGNWDMAYVHRLDWADYVETVIQGVVPTEQLLVDMAEQVEARRSAPF